MDLVDHHSRYILAAIFHRIAKICKYRKYVAGFKSLSTFANVAAGIYAMLLPVIRYDSPPSDSTTEISKRHDADDDQANCQTMLQGYNIGHGESLSDPNSRFSFHTTWQVCHEGHEYICERRFGVSGVKSITSCAMATFILPTILCYSQSPSFHCT